MKAIEIAETFAALKDLTDATDEQLARMLVNGCSPVPAMNYEDAMTEHLLRVFRQITGVRWIRGWEQGSRPDSQYATLWLYAVNRIGSAEIEYHRVFNSATNEYLDDLCEVSYQIFDYQFQLDVYRDNGVSNRNQETPVETGPRYSAVDVLTRLVTAFGHWRFREALLERCLSLGAPPFSQIRNLAKPMVQNTFEGRASVDFFIRGRTVSSLRSPTFGDIDWGIVCPPDEALFPDPPEPAVC